jgi:uncharacterized protein (DUF58 family)
VNGDSSTHIHWKSTAKLARLMAKEFEDEQKQKVSILLDVSLPSQKIPVNFYQDVEQAISLAASYTMYFFKNHVPTQLITPTQKSKFDEGQHHFLRLLRLLALLQPTNGTSSHRITKSLQALNRANVMHIVISVNQNGDTPRGFSKRIFVNSGAKTPRTGKPRKPSSKNLMEERIP